MSDTVSPYVAASAASDRTEGQVREAQIIPLTLRAADALTPLLEKTIQTKEIYNEAIKKSARFTSTDNLIERVDADIAKQVAYEAHRDAESAYDKAIADFVKAKREDRRANA